MINGNCFRKLVDTTASAVLVVGPMGAGKSTTIGIQTGAKYEAVKEEASRIKVVIYSIYIYSIIYSISAHVSPSRGAEALVRTGERSWQQCTR